MKRTEIYYPDGRVLVRSWEDGTRPALAWIQRAVDGYIEAIDRFLPDGGPGGRVQAYANEEGRLIGLPGNVPGMKALNWPEPPGGWSAFDAESIPEPGPAVLIGFGQSQEEMAAALERLSARWDPVVGPIVMLRGWCEVDHNDEEGLEPEDFGTLHSVSPAGVLVRVPE